MPLLASPWRRIRQEEPVQAIATEPVAEMQRPDPASTIDRLLVLRPTEGGLAFRMYGFPDVAAANEYVQTHLWLEAQAGVKAFWALHAPMGPPDVPSEAVVVIRDPYHPGIVQLYAFVNMNAAQDFVRSEFRNGIDLNLVLVYWAESVDIDRPPEIGSDLAVDRAYYATPTIARHAKEFPRELKRVPVTVQEKPKQMSQTPAQSSEAVEPQDNIEETGEPSGLSAVMHRVMEWPGWDGLVPRMFQAMTLNEDVFQETEKDKHATGRARLLFGIAIFAAGFGALGAGVITAFWQIAFAAAGWFAYAAIIYGFGTTVAGGRKTPTTFRFLVRTLGLAAAPGIFLALGIIPVYGAIPVLGVYVWVFLTTVHAISPSLDMDRDSSVVTAAVGSLTLFAIAQVLPILLV